MTSIFDTLPDRRATESLKWRAYPADVLPMWVADMDFRSPEPVIAALHERVEHGVFGYPGRVSGFNDVIIERLAQRYGWQVSADQIVMVPGVVTGFNWVAQTLCAPGQAVLVQTPVYPPFLSAPANGGLLRQDAALVQRTDGRYEIDFEAFEQAITPQTSLFILCNPHNPVGRVFTPAELTRLAEICLRHNVLICSDEIHCDLIYEPYRHTPIASLSEEIAQKTVTLMAPSKTYNIAGLECSFAIVSDAALRQRLQEGRRGVVGWVNVLGQVAALAAYRDGQPWLDELLQYLQANRDLTARFVNEQLPGVRMGPIEGTYLAWLDCRDTGLQDPYQFFLDEGRVALSNGADFGPGGQGFVRLNFGCPRSMLQEALERMRRALIERNG
jgi:cystathionine beta-lyase